MIKLIRLFFIGTTLFLFGCNSQNKNEAKSETTASDTTKNTDIVRTNTSFLFDLKALEEIFTNDNWMMAIDKKDTSYFYFSKLGDFTVNTYEYILEKGDSAEVKKSNILVEGDKIVWQFDGKKLNLEYATKARAVWRVSGNDSLKYAFEKVNQNEVELTYPDKHKQEMKRTLSFSLFLVRSRYDFAHGTKLAFDTTQFNKKK